MWFERSATSWWLKVRKCSSWMTLKSTSWLSIRKTSSSFLRRRTNSLRRYTMLKRAKTTCLLSWQKLGPSIPTSTWGLRRAISSCKTLTRRSSSSRKRWFWIWNSGWACWRKNCSWSMPLCREKWLRCVSKKKVSLLASSLRTRTNPA